jgi:hypothetical protein
MFAIPTNSKSVPGAGPPGGGPRDPILHLRNILRYGVSREGGKKNVAILALDAVFAEFGR